MALNAFWTPHGRTGTVVLIRAISNAASSARGDEPADANSRPDCFSVSSAQAAPSFSVQSSARRARCLFISLRISFTAAVLSRPLRRQIENLAFVVDLSPEPESTAGDQNRVSSRCQREVGRGVAGEGPWRTTARTSTPSRWTSPMKRSDDIEETEGKAKIQPHGMPDNVRRELASERGLHRPSYPRKRGRRPLASSKLCWTSFHWSSATIG
jgi:hypothetical protein